MSSNTKDYNLAFAKWIGSGSGGQQIYRLDFTEEPEAVWGNGWNFKPAGSNPNIEPDEGTICCTAKLISEEEYNTAAKSTCFSMQDCIDGIVPLLFSVLPSENPLILRFGETLGEIEERLHPRGLSLSEVKETGNTEQSLIDSAMQKLDEEENG